MCSPPNCLAASATMRSTCSRLVTSAGSGITRRPVSAANSRAACSRGSLVRAAMATSTPSRANSWAMALPIPRLPPTTIACLPCSPRSMIFPPCVFVYEGRCTTYLAPFSSRFFVPSPGGLIFTHMVLDRGERAHDMVHEREIRQMLQAFPQHGHSRFTIATAGQKAAQAANPMHGLPQGGRCRRRRGGDMNGAVERLPFLQFQQGGTRGVRHRPAQQGGIEEAPGNHTVQRQTAPQSRGGLQLPGFNATAALEHFMPDLDPPTAGIPVHALNRGRRGMHGTGGQQHPLDRVTASWRLLLYRLDGPDRHTGQFLGGAVRG